MLHFRLVRCSVTAFRILGLRRLLQRYESRGSITQPAHTSPYASTAGRPVGRKGGLPWWADSTVGRTCLTSRFRFISLTCFLLPVFIGAYPKAHSRHRAPAARRVHSRAQCLRVGWGRWRHRGIPSNLFCRLIPHFKLSKFRRDSTATMAAAPLSLLRARKKPNPRGSTFGYPVRGPIAAILHRPVWSNPSS